MDTEYEDAVVALLNQELRWTITVLDDGIRQNVPDLLLELGDKAVLLEIKTASKRSGLVTKEDAFAVLQKGADFDSARHHYSTLGKPRFNESSKLKAAASTKLTLIEHGVFLDAVLRVLAGEIDPPQFFEWLCEPGIAEFERIPGRATYMLS